MRNHCTSGPKPNRSYGHKVTQGWNQRAYLSLSPHVVGQSRSHRHSFIPNRPKPNPYTAATQMAHPCNRCPSAPKSPYNRTKCVWMRRQRYKYCESVDALTHFVRAEASQQHRRVVTKIRIPISRISVREDRGRIRIDPLASTNRTPQQI